MQAMFVDADREEDEDDGASVHSCRENEFASRSLLLALHHHRITCLSIPVGDYISKHT